MAVLRIAKMGNPVLLKRAAPVPDPTAPEIRRLAADMQETLEDIGASGLAAPQVFVSKRVVVYRIIASRIPEGSGLQPRPWTVMINPVIAPKTEAIVRTGADAVVTGCPGCMMQLSDGLKQQGAKTRVMHTLEILARKIR